MASYWFLWSENVGKHHSEHIQPFVPLRQGDEDHVQNNVIPTSGIGPALRSQSEFISSHENDPHHWDFEEQLYILYNRVPKTGSTTFVNIAYDLCKRNHFHVLHINVTANMHILSLPNQVIFIRLSIYVFYIQRIK